MQINELIISNILLTNLNKISTGYIILDLLFIFYENKINFLNIFNKLNNKNENCILFESSDSNLTNKFREIMYYISINSNF